MKDTLLVFCSVCALVSVECAINLCLPVDSLVFNDVSLEKLLEGTKADIAEKLNDTVDVGHVDLNLKHPAIRLNGTLDNVQVNDLTQFNLCLLDILQPNKSDLFNITFPSIRIKGDYDVFGNIGELFDIFGKGDFWVQFKNFSVAMTHFNASIIGNELCVVINIEVDLVEMKNHFRHFMNDHDLECLFNKAFETIASEAVSIIWQEAKDWFEEIINAIFHAGHAARILQKMFFSPAAFKDDLQLPFCITNEDLNNNNY